jgi:hypothetical protein
MAKAVASSHPCANLQKKATTLNCCRIWLSLVRLAPLLTARVSIRLSGHYMARFEALRNACKRGIHAYSIVLLMHGRGQSNYRVSLSLRSQCVSGNHLACAKMEGYRDPPTRNPSSRILVSQGGLM